MNVPINDQINMTIGGNMKVIECLDLTKVYISKTQSQQALAHVSFSMEAGEYVAVVGKSGSGKSTLLNMIGLIDVPTSGELWIGEQNTKELSENKRADLRNQKIGYVFQAFYLEPAYTAYKNVEMPLLIGGVDKKERKERVMKALETVGLAHKAKQRADTLSGGEKQRVCIARALVGEPEFILADEPCGNLDSENSKDIMTLFERLNSEGKTILLVTHNEEDAKRAKRRIRMLDGGIVADETL